VDREKALQLAQKLARMTTEGGCTEAEAMLAAERLAKIAKEHNISRMDYTEEQVRAKVKSEQTSMDLDRRAKPPLYVGILVSRLCESFGCRAVFIGGEYVGDETNIVLLKFFMNELLPIIPKLRWKAKCEMGVAGNNPVWKQSWERGFIEAVGQRLDKIMGQLSDEQASRSRALVLVTKELVNAEVEKKYPRLTRSKQKVHGLDRTAFEKGMRDGKTAKLQEQIQ
jgi:hypothetical protein